MTTQQNKKFTLGILLTFIVCIGSAIFATYSTGPYGNYPNPGHPANEIGPGTFNASNNANPYWKFPGDLNVTGKTVLGDDSTDKVTVYGIIDALKSLVIAKDLYVRGDTELGYMNTNKVKAYQYCDENGANCHDASSGWATGEVYNKMKYIDNRGGGNYGMSIVWQGDEIKASDLASLLGITSSDAHLDVYDFGTSSGVSYFGDGTGTNFDIWPGRLVYIRARLELDGKILKLPAIDVSELKAISDNTEWLCSDGVDNDHDGFTDTNDTDCPLNCSCEGTGYETYDREGDTVYVDCNANKCWTPTAGSYSWDSAVAHCNNLDYGGFKDWVLPDKTTLGNLCTQQGHTPFGDGYSYYYWSSTESSSSGYAYEEYFPTCNQYSRSESDSLYVRCVRG